VTATPQAAGAAAASAAAAARLRFFIEFVSRWMNYTAGWVFVFCALFVTFDVFARSFLGFSSQSTTELTGYMLAFGIAWGLPHALATRNHVRIDMILNKVPLRGRQYLHLFALSLLGVLAGFLSFGAVELVQESLDFGATDNSLLRTPLALPQGLWTVGIVVFFILIVAMMIETLLLIVAGQAEAVDRLLGPRSYTEEAAEALEAVAVSRQDTK